MSYCSFENLGGRLVKTKFVMHDQNQTERLNLKILRRKKKISFMDQLVLDQ